MKLKATKTMENLMTWMTYNDSSIQSFQNTHEDPWNSLENCVWKFLGPVKFLQKSITFPCKTSNAWGKSRKRHVRSLHCERADSANINPLRTFHIHSGHAMIKKQKSASLSPSDFPHQVIKTIINYHQWFNGFTLKLTITSWETIFTWHPLASP